MIRIPRIFYILPLLALFCLCNAAELLDVSKVIKTAATVTHEAYPDADDILLDDKVIVRYKPDGTYTSVDDCAIKILTDRGIEGHQCLRFPLNIYYGDISATLLQLIDEKGNITPLPVKELSALITDNSDMESNIYDPNNKILVVRIPYLRKNMTLRFVIEQTCKKARMPGAFSYWENLEHTSPVLHYQLEILAPNKHPLKHHLLASQVGKTATYRTETLKDGTVRHIWEAKHVPQAFPEPQMPKLYTCTQRAMASTLDSWQQISQWDWKICEPHLKVTDDIKAKVKELTEKAADDQAKIWNIFTFVSQEIRYMGETTETDAPGYEPHDVAQTFNKRHGVCRDKAALLVAMLRQAGFQAYPVLINVGEQLDPQMPMIFFNHQIVAVYQNGQYLLMDPTNETTNSLLPEYLYNRSYLVARPEGDTLRISPVPPPTTNQFDVQTTCVIQQDGKLTGRTILQFKGLQDNMYRGFFAESSLEQLQTYLQLLLSRAVPGVQLLQYELTPTNVMDTSIPLKLELFYEAPNTMNTSGSIAFFQPPDFQTLSFIPRVFTGLYLSKRRFPYMTRYPLSEHQKTTIIVTPEWGYIQPPPQPELRRTSKLEWQKNASIENNVLTMDETCTVAGVQFTPSEYMELKNTFDDIQNAQVPILIQRNKPRQKTPKRPNETILEEKTDITLFTPTSRKTTRYLKKQILTYGGKKDVEISIPFLPDYEKVKLDFVRVYNNGRFQELDVKECKIMDADWNGEAPRYPKGKILIANPPGVEIGSVIEYQFTEEARNLVDFNITNLFQNNVPALYTELIIRKPKDLKLNLQCKQNGRLGSNKPERLKQTWETQKNGTEVYKWVAEGMDSIEFTSNTPQPQNYVPYIEATTCIQQQWLADLRKAIQTKSVPDKQIKEFVQNLKKLSPMQKMIAIRNHVDQNVYTAGPSFHDLPFSCLTPAATTFAECYGNDMDKAILLNTLLKEAGFSPKIYLVDSIIRDAKTTSEMNKFFEPTRYNDVLVQARCDNVDVWLNEDNIYAQPGTTGYQGCEALTLDGQLAKILPDALYQNKTKSLIETKIQADGFALVKHTQFFWGADYNHQKKIFINMTPEEIRRHHQELAGGYSPTATPEGEFTITLDKYPGSISYSVSIPRFARFQGNKLYFDAGLYAPLFLKNGLAARTLPIATTDYRQDEMEIIHHLPKEYSVPLSLPANAIYQLPDSNCKTEIKCQLNGNTLKLNIFNTRYPSIWSADRYRQLLEINRKLDSDSNTTIILGKP